ncbi:Bax inhibitor-1 family protein [Altericista sp. CCNU0014]|uniref:Bax inhibitor-1/YccA family protein n=1 Tax=Altericista sp. CCNU0014 TaxID=3082949 RepID=UPI0038507306
MSNTSNFREAVRQAKQNALVGPNVIQNALPFVGGGLVLTAFGAWGGLGVLQQYPALFMPTFIVALIAEIALFFIAQGVAARGNNKVALPLLATYSLLSGYTLAMLLNLALRTNGVGLTGLGIAALSCGVTFIAARSIGSNLSEQDGFALTKTIQLGIIALVVVMLGQLIVGLFMGGMPQWWDIAISGIGVVLFVGAAVVDFFILPRTYKDEEYLPAALSMYLTYINLFVFILRLLIALNSRD